MTHAVRSVRRWTSGYELPLQCKWIYLRFFALRLSRVYLLPSNLVLVLA